MFVRPCPELAITASAVPFLERPRVGVTVCVGSARFGADLLHARPRRCDLAGDGLAGESRHALAAVRAGEPEAPGVTAAGAARETDVRYAATRGTFTRLTTRQ